VETQSVSILKVRLEGGALDVEQMAQSLQSVLEIVEESRSFATTDGKKVCRYLVALVRREQ
jgi:hypothetical protein